MLQARGSLAAVIVFAAALAGTLILRPPNWAAYAPVIFAAGLAALLHYIPARENLGSARLIVENAIIRIQPAVIYGRTEEEKENEDLRENFGIYVSVFGILLGGKIIKFNQSGIWLRSVEIGRDYISFGYGGKDEELQNIRLLYSRPGGDALAGIVENFRREIGVVPTIL